MPTVTKPTPPLPIAVEGVDYTIEAGRWVFTATYHLKRGSCCGSGCINCPYRDQPKDQAGPRDTNLRS